MKAELKQIEDKILLLLSNSTGNILEDEELINTLAQAKVMRHSGPGASCCCVIGTASLASVLSYVGCVQCVHQCRDLGSLGPRWHSK
jgi:ATP-binding dynein motor region